MSSSRIVSRAALFLALSLAVPGAAPAVEVRQAETGSHYHARLVQAFAPCLAPNDVSVRGIPACSPPVTSACGLVSTGTVDIDGAVGALPTLRASVPSGHRPAGCPSGPFTLDVTVRTSGARIPAGGEGSDDTPTCTSGECTYQDVVLHFPIAGTGLATALVGLPEENLLDPNFEIIDVTLFGTDGLPMASAGVRIDGAITSNLTVPYDVCTTPDPDGTGFACNRTPWNSACDFNVGSIEWSQASNFYPPSVHVTLTELTGSSPLCTTGTYRVEASVRGTLDGCTDEPFSYHPCTLVDQTVSLPMVANGRDLDGAARLDLGAFSYQYRYAQISALRIIDPTGQPIAATGVTGVRNLVAPRIGLKDDTIRIRATLPIERPDASIDVTLDPRLEAGMTLALTDRNGLVYTVSIPGMLWQLQPPIGSRWTYVDKGGVLAGVRKASIKRVGKAGVATGYAVDVQARGVDLSAADFPGMNLTMAIARPGSDQPQRAQRSRTCRVKGAKLTCK